MFPLWIGADGVASNHDVGWLDIPVEPEPVFDRAKALEPETLDIVAAIRAKPHEEWTEAEQRFVDDGAAWVMEVGAVLSEAFRTIQQNVERATRRTLPVFDSIRVDLSHHFEPERARWTGPTDVALDQFRHVDGVPGVSARCWSDEWFSLCTAECAPECLEHGDYMVCNAEAGTNDLGLCGDHLAKLRAL